MGNSSCELSVSTAGGSIGVGRHTHEATPVLEVAQLGCVDFVDYLTIGSHTISTAPQAVLRLDDEV